MQRFYEVLGFTEVGRMTLPDQVTGALLGLASPIGFEAVYLDSDGFILQLITFAGYPAPEAAPHAILDAGLTHLSFAVADVSATLAAVTAAGGAVIAAPEAGAACLVRDPEGQLLELFEARWRPAGER